MGQENLGSELRTLIRRLFSFGIIGIALTIGGAIFIEWTVGLGWRPDVANGFQAVISIVLNFILNRQFTWPDRRGLSIQQQAWRFTKIKALTLTTNYVSFQLLLGVYEHSYSWTEGFLSDTLFAYLVSTGIIMVFNYIAGDRYVYQRKGQK